MLNISQDPHLYPQVFIGTLVGLVIAMLTLGVEIAYYK